MDERAAPGNGLGEERVPDAPLVIFHCYALSWLLFFLSLSFWRKEGRKWWRSIVEEIFKSRARFLSPQTSFRLNEMIVVESVDKEGLEVGLWI